MFQLVNKDYENYTDLVKDLTRDCHSELEKVRYNCFGGARLSSVELLWQCPFSLFECMCARMFEFSILYVCFTCACSINYTFCAQYIPILL